VFNFVDGLCGAGEKGHRASDFLAFAAGDRFKIVVTGDTVTYERNEEVFYTSTKKQEAHLPVANRHELLRTWYNGNERGAAHRSINQAHRVEPARLVD
jgi:hypothetical protein